MGVDIDPAWRDQQPVRVDFPLAGAGLTTDLGDFSVLERNVAGERGGAGSIDDGAAAYDCIVQGFLPIVSEWGRAPQAGPVQHPRMPRRIEIRVRAVQQAPIVPHQ